MNLDFSDDQKYLQEEARKFFEKEGGLAMLERSWTNHRMLIMSYGIK